MEDTAKTWLQPLLLILLTIALSGPAGLLLERILKTRRLARFSSLSGPLSSLLIPIGISLALENVELPGKAAKWLQQVLFVLVVVLALRVLRRGALISVEWISNHGAAAKALQQGFVPLIRNLVNLFTLAAGSIMILKNFGYDVLSLLTALGVGSLAVGLAAKETLSNMISGFTLVMDRNLLPGDQLTIGGTTGQVDEIGLRSTRIRTPQGHTLIVPNSEMVNTRILNLSQPGRGTAIQSQIKLALGTPVEPAITLIHQVVVQLSERAENREPAVWLTAISEAGLLLTIQFWILNPSREAEILSQLHREILRRFEDHGIRLAGAPAGTPA